MKKEERKKTDLRVLGPKAYYSGSSSIEAVYTKTTLHGKYAVYFESWGEHRESAREEEMLTTYFERICSRLFGASRGG